MTKSADSYRRTATFMMQSDDPKHIETGEYCIKIAKFIETYPAKWQFFEVVRNQCVNMYLRRGVRGLENFDECCKDDWLWSTPDYKTL